MTICFFSPYLPNHTGGGEKHLFDVALELAHEHTVSIAVSQDFCEGKSLEEIRKKYEIFYGKSLASCHFITTPLFSAASFFTKLFWTAQFDALYFVTDGSLFFSLAKYNFLHIQIPFTAPLSILGRVKLWQWHRCNVNSRFTRGVIQKSWGIQTATVLYPVISQPGQHPEQKKSLILAVGRFFRGSHAKRQDVLIEVFSELNRRYPEVLQEWQLVLAGSCEDEAYLSELQAAAAGLPVTFAVGISRTELDALYAQARIFWHAAGYGISEEKHPEQVEHFGITTVEAMAAGVVPLAVGKGGQKEILSDDLSELLWQEREECVAKSLELITNSAHYTRLQNAVKERAAFFGPQRFSEQVRAFFQV